MNKQNWKFSSASSSNSTSETRCVNNHLVSLVELLLEAEENFQFCLFIPKYPNFCAQLLNARSFLLDVGHIL